MKNLLLKSISLILILGCCAQNNQKQKGVESTELSRDERIERVLKEFEKRGFEIDSIYSDEDIQNMRDTMNVAEAERMIIGYDELNLYPDKPNMHPADSLPKKEVVYDEKIGLTYLAMNKKDRDTFIKELRSISEITDETIRDNCYNEWCKKYGFLSTYK